MSVLDPSHGPSADRKTFFPRQLLFAAFALALILLAVEAGAWLLLRLVQDPDPQSVAGGTPADDDDFRQAAADRLSSYQAIHPFLGFVLDPDHHPEAKRKTSNPTAKDHGFAYSRSTLFHQRSEEKLIVGVFGGSVASILSFNGAQALRQGLSLIPRFAAREIHILSLAMGGFKQPQQLQTLAYMLALGAHFDLILNVDGFNEVALPPVDNLSAGVFPFFPRKWHLRVAELDPESRQAIGRLTYFRQARRERAERYLASGWRASSTSRLLWTLSDRRHRARVAQAEEALSETQPGTALDYQARGPKREYASELELYEDLAVHWQRSSRQMYYLSRAAGAEYYHVLQPNQYLPQSKPLSAAEKRDAWRENHRYRPGVVIGYPQLIARGKELAEEGIAFLDATDAFREIDQTLYIDPCCHFNREGNEILATAILRLIAASSP